MDFSKINLSDHQPLARLIVQKAVTRNFKNRNEFQKFRNKITKEQNGIIFHNLYFIKAYNDLVIEGKIKANPKFLTLIQKRSVRTLSGVAPVTVLMKPYPCPGKCIYCPTDVRMPKSYIPSQPAAQRAFRQRFDPYTQIFVRLRALTMTGHEISKVELRILGGSFTAYKKHYQTWFIKRCLQAMNEFHELDKKTGKSLESKIKKNIIKSPYGTDEVNTVIVKSLSQKACSWKEVNKNNETAKVRCIGINIETRPDLITKKIVKRLRNLGVTKVELGAQTIFDDIQKKSRRGHFKKETIHATQLLKDSGFKLSYHIMPNLPGSTPKKDKKMIPELFCNPDFQPDYLKIYPCVVLKNTLLAQKYKKNEYKPYTEKILKKILKDNLKNIPEWCRIDRIARDIPSNDIEAGFRASNIRQIIEKELKEEGIPPRDIRFREIQNEKIEPKKVKLVVREYEASQGKELFISYEDMKKDKLVALLRLRFPHKTFLKELKTSALIREIHVYGAQVAVGKKGKNQKQHLGWGSKLMKEAEKKAKNSGFKKISVIAGIGTREYYRKKGYKLEGTYMVKKL